MRLQLPRCSFRQDAAGMAGAIFMSNSETRERCFSTGVFGLPPEYEPFVVNVKQGMPLFLFDYTHRKLYGVFEATSDGGMDISRAAFRSTGRTYPAQVCFNIVWKCRPLTEDEFFPAIEENYYISKRFYFDLSYQQVVRLYGLFHKKRVDHPICNYSTSANLEKEHSSRRRPDKKSLNPNSSPFTADHSHTLIPSSTPKMSTVETNCSASTSMHPVVPPTFETQPNVSMPSVTESFGVQTAPSHSSQIKLPYHSHEHLRDVSTIDGISTQVPAHCSQTARYHRDQFVASQSYPLSHDYPHNSLSSGRMTQVPTDGVRLSEKQSYVSSSMLSSRYLTQVPAGDERSYLCSAPYVPSYRRLSLASPQRNAHWKDDYDIHCDQCKEIYASEHQHLNSGKSLTPPELTQEGIPTYPEAPEVSGIIQQKESFTDYIPIPDCTEDFGKEQQRRDFNHGASGSSGSGNDTGAYMSGRSYINHDVGAGSNRTIPSQRPQKSVFSRLSLKPQPPSEEITGPSLNELFYLLSRSDKNRTTEDVRKQLVSEQIMERPCPAAELNLPSGLEEESADPPFLNFKRRSKAARLDTNVGKEVSDKVKRRKLVRPSFGEYNNTASSGKELQGNVIMERNHGPALMERNHSPVETGGNKFDIDLNEPASVDMMYWRMVALYRILLLSRCKQKKPVK